MAEKKQITLGKWIVVNAEVLSGDRLVANCGGYSTNYKLTREENIANAELIASAPDLLAENTRLKAINQELLEALKEIEKGEGAFSLDHFKHLENCFLNMQRLAREAIALAESEVK